MKSTLRTVIALVVGIIIGMLMPATHGKAQNPVFQPANNANDCEQHYQTAFANFNTPEVGSLHALLYLACKEHSR